MKWRAVLLTGLIALAPALASAETLLQAGLVGSRTNRYQGQDMVGLGGTAVFFSQSWLSIPLRADAARKSEEWLGLVTVGVRLGTTQGRARPYFETFLGVTPGTPSFAGIATGYGAGGTLELGETMGFFIDVASVNSGNFEYDGHFIQARAGLQWRVGRRTP